MHRQSFRAEREQQQPKRMCATALPVAAADACLRPCHSPAAVKAAEIRDIIGHWQQDRRRQATYRVLFGRPLAPTPASVRAATAASCARIAEMWTPALPPTTPTTATKTAAAAAPRRTELARCPKLETKRRSEELAAQHPPPKQPRRAHCSGRHYGDALGAGTWAEDAGGPSLVDRILFDDCDYLEDHDEPVVESAEYVLAIKQEAQASDPPVPAVLGGEVASIRSDDDPFKALPDESLDLELLQCVDELAADAPSVDASLFEDLLLPLAASHHVRQERGGTKEASTCI